MEGIGITPGLQWGALGLLGALMFSMLKWIVIPSMVQLATALRESSAVNQKVADQLGELKTTVKEKLEDVEDRMERLERAVNDRWPPRKA